MLDAEHKVDSAVLQDGVFDPKIPRCALEAMQNIARNIFVRNVFMHDVAQVFHLEIAFAVHLHQSFLEENFLVKKSFLSSDCLETRWDILVAIADHHNKEIVLGKFCFGVNLETVVVMETSSDCCLQFLERFVIHCDTHGNLRVILADSATGSDLGHH